MSSKYKKEKDNNNFLTVAVAIIVLFIFSIVAAVISLNVPDIIYLFGVSWLPMSVGYFVFGLFVLVWGFAIIIFMRILSAKERYKKKR